VEYIEHPLGADCHNGSEVTSTEECEYAATSLSIFYVVSTAVDLNTVPYGCYYTPGATPSIFFNTCSDCGPSSANLQAICRKEATPVPTAAPWVANGLEYMQLGIGTGCPSGPEVTSLEECEYAVASLEIFYSTSSSVESHGVKHGCYYTPGATPVIFFNTCFDCGPSSIDSYAICRWMPTPQPTLEPTAVPTPLPTLPPTPPPTLAQWDANAWEYMQLDIGLDCPGPGVTSLEECEHASTSLSIFYGSSSAVDLNTVPYGCYYTPGGTPLIFFNSCSSCGPSSTDSQTICRRVPTPQPTPASTPQSAPASTPMQTVKATGDPHLQNIHGQHFDLMKPGKHVLIHLPRKAPIANALLHVKGKVKQLGGPCEMYFQELNITGKWADRKRSGGFKFHASKRRRKRDSNLLHLGKVAIKVVHGRTTKGARYLNFFVKHLSKTGLVVGGLLGEDDHSREAVRSSSCRHRVAL